MSEPQVLTPEEVESRARRRADCYCELCTETRDLIATIRAAWAERDEAREAGRVATKTSLLAVEAQKRAEAEVESLREKLAEAEDHVRHVDEVCAGWKAREQLRDAELAQADAKWGREWSAQRERAERAEARLRRIEQAARELVDVVDDDGWLFTRPNPAEAMDALRTALAALDEQGKGRESRSERAASAE